MPKLIRNARFSLFRFWRGRRHARRQALLDAERLLKEFGADAYERARTLARNERLERLDTHLPAEHWDHVRFIIGRRTSREHVDTATRYLEG